MRQFKDKLERTWNVAITIPILRQLKEDDVIDLLADRDPFKSIPLFLAADTITQVDAIGVAVQHTKQDQEYEVYDFAAALNEDSIWSAAMAFMEAFADFYPTHSRLIETILTKARASMNRNREKVTERVESGYFNEMIESGMTSSDPLGNGSSSLPDTVE